MLTLKENKELTYNAKKVTGLLASRTLGWNKFALKVLSKSFFFSGTVTGEYKTNKFV